MVTGLSLLSFTPFLGAQGVSGGAAPASTSAPASAPARIVGPPVGDVPQARLITPAEEAAALELYPATFLNQDEMQRMPDLQVDTAFAQFDTVIKERAKVWVASLPKGLVTGLQIDPMGQLYVAIGQDSIARRLFAQRLSTPKLSVDDRAFTLFAAITAFLGRSSLYSAPDPFIDPVHVRIAQEYLTQLDALPEIASRRKFDAHVLMGSAYYWMGDGPNAAIHLKRALSLVPSLVFDERLDACDAYRMLADVISAQPKGRETIDSVTKWLRPYYAATPEMIAADPTAKYMGERSEFIFNQAVQVTDFLGRSAPAMTGHYFWNTSKPATPSTADTSARVIPVNDGKIRVIEFGHRGCTACMLALPKLDRARKTAPQNVDYLYVTHGDDSWGGKECKTTAECAEHYREYYVEQRKLGLPIAIWFGAREADVDGGTQQKVSPTFAAVPMNAVPMFMVTDGRGIVRHISIGYSQLLSRTVKYLQAESAHNAAVGTASAAPSSDASAPSHGTAQ